MAVAVPRVGKKDKRPKAVAQVRLCAAAARHAAPALPPAAQHRGGGAVCAPHARRERRGGARRGAARAEHPPGTTYLLGTYPPSPLEAAQSVFALTTPPPAAKAAAQAGFADTRRAREGEGSAVDLRPGDVRSAPKEAHQRPRQGPAAGLVHSEGLARHFHAAALRKERPGAIGKWAPACRRPRRRAEPRKGSKTR